MSVAAASAVLVLEKAALVRQRNGLCVVTLGERD
jgi:hypothetical protein